MSTPLIHFVFVLNLDFFIDIWFIFDIQVLFFFYSAPNKIQRFLGKEWKSGFRCHWIAKTPQHEIVKASSGLPVSWLPGELSMWHVYLPLCCLLLCKNLNVFRWGWLFDFASSVTREVMSLKILTRRVRTQTNIVGLISDLKQLKWL